MSPYLTISPLSAKKHGGRYSFCGTFQSLRTAPVRSRLSCWSPDFPSAIKHGGRPSRHSMYINYSFKKILSTTFYFSILILLDCLITFVQSSVFRKKEIMRKKKKDIQMRFYLLLYSPLLVYM